MNPVLVPFVLTALCDELPLRASEKLDPRLAAAVPWTSSRAGFQGDSRQSPASGRQGAGTGAGQHRLQREPARGRGAEHGGGRRAVPPLVRGNAEELPFADASFDLVFCDHGAMGFTDPTATVPQVARVLRPGSQLHLRHADAVHLGDLADGRRTTRPDARASVLRDAPDAVEDENDPTVEFQLTYGEWIRLFRANGFAVEDLIELRPPADAVTAFEEYVTLDWARDFPAEHIWKVRKESR